MIPTPTKTSKAATLNARTIAPSVVPDIYPASAIAVRPSLKPQAGASNAYANRAAVILIGLLLVAAVAWNAAELHYRNCVNTAKAITGSPATTSLIGPSPLLIKKINGCSRLPF